MRQVFIIIFCVFGLFYNAQMKRTATVGFYNVENLWDTVKSVDYIVPYRREEQGAGQPSQLLKIEDNQVIFLRK